MGEKKYPGSTKCPDCVACVECARIVHYDYDHVVRTKGGVS